jgi:tetratricopeptide (TPR) repeat protein
MPHSHHLITASLVLFGLLISIDGISQKDNIRKNNKISKAENKRYEKDLKTHPNSAEPHWRHANIVGAFNFKEAEEAWRYYDMALKIDSTNAAIWTDFGDYLLNVYDDKKVALNLYKRAQTLEPENKKLEEKVEELTKSIEQIQETIRLRSIGKSDHRKIDHDIKYSVISNLDSLQTITSIAESPYSYEKLLKRFLGDDPLNEWETYMLCLGYAKTEHYSPYSDVTSDLYKFNKAGDYDKTIESGEELLRKNPVSASLYRELMYAHRRKGENEIADLYQRRAQRLYDAMIFTGDGTCDKPYITLTTTEEYALINYLGLYSTGEQALMRCNGAQTDRLKIEDRDGKEDALYFDVRLLFKKMSEAFKK